MPESRSHHTRAASTGSPADPAPAQQLRVQTELTTGGAVIVRVAGELDMATAPVLRERLRAAQAAATPPAALIVDLTNVSFLGATGLGLLIETHRRAVELGSPLYLVSTRHYLRRALQITGLDQTLTLQPTIGDALNGAPAPVADLSNSSTTGASLTTPVRHRHRTRPGRRYRVVSP
jgi:anti-anti-sigma factor